jgi:D-alanyl-D-alanine carboxypeptidase
MYPASTTKLLTALLLAENRKEQDILDYSSGAKSTYPYKLNLPAGDELSAEACMDALLLYSANDVAVMIAENLSGSITGFAALMNAKAEELGLKGSHFTNPHGLHDDEHFTTAYELSLLVRAALRNSRVFSIMRKKEAWVTSLQGMSFHFKNRNKLIGINGCIAGKTGYTDEAGRCLVAVYERNGRKMLGVLLNSEYDREDTIVFKDMENLMDWSYSAKREILYHEDSHIANVSLTVKLIPFLGPHRTIIVPLVLSEKVEIYNNDEKKETVVVLDAIDPWKLDRQTAVGTLILKRREHESAYPLYPRLSWQDIAKENLDFYLVVLASLTLLIGAATSTITQRQLSSLRKTKSPLSS